MKLYSIQDKTKLKPVSNIKFDLEKDIQVLFEKNLEELFSLQFVKSEFSIKSFRIDSLGYDSENKSFVIIEYKKDRNFSVIDQINEVYGTELKEEDKVCLKSVGEKLFNNTDLDSIVWGDNSQDDKKDLFINIFKDYIGDYYSDRMEFYKKVNNPKVLPLLIDVMFNDYLRQKNL